MIEQVLKEIGECEIQFKLIEAKKTSLIKKALEFIANGQSAQNSKNGETETPSKLAEEN